jgi:hypothetical protein
MLNFNEETTFDGKGNSKKKFYINNKEQSEDVFNSLFEDSIQNKNTNYNNIDSNSEEINPYLFNLADKLKKSNIEEAVQILAEELEIQYTTGLLTGRYEILETLGMTLLKQSAFCEEELKNMYEE